MISDKLPESSSCVYTWLTIYFIHTNTSIALRGVESVEFDFACYQLSDLELNPYASHEVLVFFGGLTSPHSATVSLDFLILITFLLITTWTLLVDHVIMVVRNFALFVNQ
jgi:hypothetical protein